MITPFKFFELAIEKLDVIHLFTKAFGSRNLICTDVQANHFATGTNTVRSSRAKQDELPTLDGFRWGGYGWPAEVNGSSDQSIASNPLACVYLSRGANAPSAIVPSEFSDAPRVYACTQQLAGPSGADSYG